MKKKFISIILMFLIFAFASIFCFAKDNFQSTNISVDVQKLNVIFDGNDYDGMNLYTIDDSKFVSVSELATLLDARLEWYSVSKKVSLKLKNKTIDIYYDSRKVRTFTFKKIL